MPAPKPRHKALFIRNIYAGQLFQIFLVSAVSTIFLTRAYLSLTGYPQVGGGTLHIAHVLWGGLLLLAASLIRFASLGWRSTLLSAGLSGVGFGLFIDEVGKFLTKDNDYFFRPASVIMYLLFVGLVLLFQWLTRNRVYTSEERTVNALRLLEQMFGHDLQSSERNQVMELLGQAEKGDPQAAALKRFVQSIPPHRIAPRSGLQRQLHTLKTKLDVWFQKPAVTRGAIYALVLLAIGSLVLSAHSLIGQQSFIAIIALVGAILFAGLTAVGLSYSLPNRKDHQAGYNWFIRALLFDLLFVEPFLFYSEQFSAVYGLLLKLALWLYFTAVSSH